MRVIVYRQDNGKTAVVYPAEEYVRSHGLQWIAARSVPHGKPFGIVDESELPKPAPQRSAWLRNDKRLTDGVGGVLPTELKLY